MEVKTPEPAIDLTNYVPKADYEQAKGELTSLQSEINKVKSQLLDADYIEFKTKKAQAQTAQPAQSTQDQPQLLDPRIDQLAEELSMLRLKLEWNETEKKYPDLNQYKDKIAALYSKTGNNMLSYEDALKLVKVAEEEAKPVEKRAAKAAFSSEKPSGSIPFQAVEQRVFKTTEEANAATVNQLRDKYPGLGDHL